MASIKNNIHDGNYKHNPPTIFCLEAHDGVRVSGVLRCTAESLIHQNQTLLVLKYHD